MNQLVKECLALHYIEVMDDNHYQVTEDGMKFMEPFKVDGAVIIAAGFGSRFVPLTFENSEGASGGIWGTDDRAPDPSAP